MVSTRYYPVFFGPALQARKINNIIESKGVDITVITQNNGKKESFEENVILKPNYNLKGLYGSKIGLLLWSLSASTYIIRNRKTIGLVHSLDLYFPTILFSIVCKIFGIPIIAKSSIQSVYTKKGITGKLKRYIYRKLTKIISISEETYNELASDNFPSENIYFIPNGVDTNVFNNSPQDRVKILRSEYNINSKSFVALYTGSINSRKGILDLLAIWSELMKMEKEAILILAGSCSDTLYVDKVKEYINMQNLNNSVMILDHINNVDVLYKLADVFLFASNNEGLPNSVLEAMASGLPIITRDISGCNDLVEDEINGFKIRNGSDFHDKYLSKLQYLVKNPDLMHKMSINNRNKSLEYDIALIAQKYFDLYNNLKN
jgi:glycosyltransferase involved in cell wall biosynthesis